MMKRIEKIASSKKLLGTSASLLVTSALLVVTRTLLVAMFATNVTREGGSHQVTSLELVIMIR